MNEAVAMAKKLASKPGAAMRVMKNTIQNGMNMDLHSATFLEVKSFLLTFSSEDRIEGMKALLEKRKPAFKDR